MKRATLRTRWTAWHLLAFWAIWFAIASGVSWIIIGGAIWRTLEDGSAPTAILVAGHLSRAATIVLAIFWSIPVVVAAWWSYGRIVSREDRVTNT
jgi:hypothetical protein